MTLAIAATLDFPGAQPQYKMVDVTVDTAAPELVGDPQISTGEKGERLLTLTFRDNLSVAGVSFLDSQTGKVLAQYGADDAAATRGPSGDLVWTQSYDVSGLGEHLTLVLGDYAWNLAQFDLDLSASGT